MDDVSKREVDANDNIKCISNARFIDELRPIEEIPHNYRRIFTGYPCFNYVQSTVFDELFYTDESVVVAAPTGSGKTALFELAILRIIMNFEGTEQQDTSKMIYISPMKALCEERVADWHKKFSPYGINCISVTGDSENIDIRELFSYNLIITTPERWDSLTRKWKDNTNLVKMIKLFMIDEVHLLGEDNRGATVEIIVCRMKTIENTVVYEEENGKELDQYKIRFVAVSAAIPNIEDIAAWIGDPPNVKYFKFSEQIRPVKLNKIVLGFHYDPKKSYFKFDLYLNYRLQHLLIQYSMGKPTLIFCNTRKSVEMTADYLIKNLTIKLNTQTKERLIDLSKSITDLKLKNSVCHGIGYHHAGMFPETKRIIENMFRDGDLPLLVTTSTLAMGVNLPAHLVIIKSTKYYQAGQFMDYTETAIMQMIGRAGRPQFDTSATAIILTTAKDKEKYEKMVENTELIESNLHKHFTEHLNAEIVLGTITDLGVAMSWLTSTFLYIRAKKRPRYYGINSNSIELIDKKLQDMCQIEINKLVKAEMLTIDMNMTLTPTPIGMLMAKYYLAFPTVKLFTQLTGEEVLQQLLGMLTKCHEFSEIYLRVNDKKCLNFLNETKRTQTIRFPLNGKIRTSDMKINCLIQAVLGCLDISDPALNAETLRIMRNSERIINGLIEYFESRDKCYRGLLNSIILSKCVKTKLWENSPFVSKQLKGIGTVIANLMVKHEKTTFEKIANTSPRELEMIINKKSPHGDNILEEVKHLPRYTMKLDKISAELIHLTISLENCQDLLELSTVNENSIMYLLVGDSDNNLIVYEKYTHSYMIENIQVIKSIEIGENIEFVEANFISEDWVGIDAVEKLQLIEDKNNNSIEASNSNCNIIKPKKKTSVKAKKIKDNNVIIEKNEKDSYQTVLERYLTKKPTTTKTIEKKKSTEQICEIENSNQEIDDSIFNAINLENIEQLVFDECNKISEPINDIPEIPANINISDNNDIENNEFDQKLNETMKFNGEQLKCDNSIVTFNENNKNEANKLKTNQQFSTKPNLQYLKQQISVSNADSIVKKFKFACTKKLVHNEENYNETCQSKKIKLDEEVNTPKSKSATHITWRSPLIYSPPVKYSPKLNYVQSEKCEISNSDNREYSTKIDIEPTLNNKNNSSNNGINCSNITLNFTKKPSQSDGNLKIRNVPMKISNEINFKPTNKVKQNFIPPKKLNSTKSDMIFPLSDSHSETYSESIHNSSILQEDLIDNNFFSPNCLEKLGIISTPTIQVSDKQSIGNGNPRNVKNRDLSAVSYYSKLMSQNRTSNQAQYANMMSPQNSELSSDKTSGYYSNQLYNSDYQNQEDGNILGTGINERYRFHNGRICAETITAAQPVYSNNSYFNKKSLNQELESNHTEKSFAYKPYKDNFQYHRASQTNNEELAPSDIFSNASQKRQNIPRTLDNRMLSNNLDNSEEESIFVQESFPGINNNNEFCGRNRPSRNMPLVDITNEEIPYYPPTPKRQSQNSLFNIQRHSRNNPIPDENVHPRFLSPHPYRQMPPFYSPNYYSPSPRQRPMPPIMRERYDMMPQTEEPYQPFMQFTTPSSRRFQINNENYNRFDYYPPTPQDLYYSQHFPYPEPTSAFDYNYYREQPHSPQMEYSSQNPMMEKFLNSFKTERND